MAAPEPREQFISFIAEVQDIAENSVTDKTLVSFGAFRRFRDWAKERGSLKRGATFEWRNGMDVHSVMWLFDQCKRK